MRPKKLVKQVPRVISKIIMFTKYQNFKPYVSYLSHLVIENQNGVRCHEKRLNISAALDGECSRELRNTVSLEARRNDGVFFTGSSLSELAIYDKLGCIKTNSIFYDPACGAGDLLISAAKRFPLENTLEKTLKNWGKQLIGRDINPVFINATRSRIALIAIQKGASTKFKKKLPLKELLPNIKVGNGLKHNNYSKITHILMNPPFNTMQADEKCSWTRGGVNSAAVFVEHCVKNAQSGTKLIAILPDVLRSGSRYELWREDLVANAVVNNIELYGRFDKSVDVDVFVLDATISNNAKTNNKRPKEINKAQKKKTVGDKFSVHVGSVVPFRNEGLGKWYPYIHAKDIASWQKVTALKENIRFTGTVYKPPFVVIRRTSRHGDKHRAVAMIVSGKKPVAVENHLIVCIPNHRTVEECKALLISLKNERTSDWLNEKIRCRHLTVSVIKDIPLWN